MFLISITQRSEVGFKRGQIQTHVRSNIQIVSVLVLMKLFLFEEKVFPPIQLIELNQVPHCYVRKCFEFGLQC